MKFLQLKDNLKNGSYPCIALTGDDVYLKGKAMETIRASLDISFEQMNTQTLEDKSSIEDILYACNTPPFCSVNRLVVANDTFLNGKIHPAKIEQWKKQLAQYVKFPNPDTCLVFDVRSNEKFFELDSLVVVDCSRLDRGAVANWIVARCAKEKVSIERSAAFLLADYCLLNMARVSKEVEKLISFGEQQIDQSLIEYTIEKDIEYAVFDLTNAISTKNSTKALELVDKMLLDKHKPNELFRLIYNYFRRMFYCLIDKSSEQQLSILLKQHPYAVKKLKESAANFTPVQLKKALDKMYATDFLTYSVMVTPDDLKMTVIQLLNLT